MLENSAGWKPVIERKHPLERIRLESGVMSHAQAMGNREWAMGRRAT
jgi:hypothetical protein